MAFPLLPDVLKVSVFVMFPPALVAAGVSSVTADQWALGSWAELAVYVTLYVILLAGWIGVLVLPARFKRSPSGFVKRDGRRG